MGGEYTPGPWHVEHHIHVKAENGWRVATVNVPSGSVGSWGISPQDTARLIAAAPELLEALEALFSSYKELADCGDAGNWYLEDLPVGKQAMAAIAKARGEVA